MASRRVPRLAMGDTPPNAPYPGERKPAPTMAGSVGSRSRVQMLRSRRQLPSGTTGFTTSSLHKPDGGYADPSAAAAAQAAAADGKAASGEPLAAQYVRNLEGQVQMLRSEVSMYRSGKPLVETHNCDLMEDIQTEAKANMQKAQETEAKAAKEAKSAEELRREMHDLRKQIATERAAAESVQNEKRFALKQREEAAGAKAKSEQQLQHTVQRMQLLENELEYVKRELASSKRKEEDFIAHSTGAPQVSAPAPRRRSASENNNSGDRSGDEAGGGGDEGEDENVDGPETLAKAAVVRGIVPAAVARRIVGDYQKILTERNTFAVEKEELERQCAANGKLIEELTASHRSLQEEVESLVAAVRHEQQRYHALLASTESERVTLDDNARELAFLKLANRELTADKQRLGNANDELFGRIRAMIDERQSAELAVANTLETTKQMQADGARVREALAEEQAINGTLRKELHDLRRKFDETTAEASGSKEQLAAAAAEKAKLDAQYAERAKQVEAALKALQMAHQKSHDAEVQGITSATGLLESLRKAEGSNAAAPNATTTAAAGAGSPTTTAPSPAPAAVPPAAATAAKVLGGVVASAQAAAAAPAAAAPAKAPPAKVAGPSVFDVARQAMDREKKLREEAAAAVLSAGRALISKRKSETAAAGESN